MRAFGAQGSALDVFSALANAKSLRHLNLYHNSGLTGPLVPPLSPLQGGLCQLARRSLSTLTADGISLTGGIPACLVNNGSSLVELHLGEPLGTPISAASWHARLASDDAGCLPQLARALLL